MSKLEEEGHVAGSARPGGSGQTGEDRDRAADERDRHADLRDSQADLRDQRAEALEQEVDRSPADLEDLRAQRVQAIADRREAAADRRRAREDRQVASADRASAAEERRSSSIDELTGAYRRGAGLIEMARELNRASRVGVPFMLAFIDIDGLKLTNDRLGHGAGDDVLRETAGLFRSYFRPYDLIVRYGGDEFLCALWDMPMDSAKKRFTELNEDLGRDGGSSVSFGLALFSEGDDLETMVNRADREMYKFRRENEASRKTGNSVERTKEIP